MTVTMNPPVLLSRGSQDAYRFSWLSDLPTPTYYVFQNGLAMTVGGTSDTELVVSVPTGQGAIVEVLDDPLALPQRVFSGSAVLGWSASAGAATYVVEAYVDAAWTAVQTVYDTGKSYYTWLSAALADSTVHLFRVVPVAANGVPGASVEFDVLMVRHPDPPGLVESYDEGTGLLGFSAA